MAKPLKQLDPLHVVVIDDSEIDRYLLARQLELINQGVFVTEYASGAEALAAITASTGAPDRPPFPDLILVDINMPLMSGFEFVQRLSDFTQQHPNLTKAAIFIISSSTNDSDRDQAHHLKDVCGFISKPPSIDSVSEALARAQTQ